MTVMILSILVGLFAGSLLVAFALYFYGKRDDARLLAEQEDDEEEVDLADLTEEEAVAILEERSPFAPGDNVLVGNPHIREFQFYIDEERLKPKSFVIERVVYDATEDVFRYKLDGMEGFYSQGWLAPNIYGTEVKHYEEVAITGGAEEEVDERATSTADSMRVAFAIEDMQIDRALDILNSDASESDKEFARKYLRGENE